jgi:predicted LPLAT superfamily acyltransferase
MHAARWLRQPERGSRQAAHGLIWIATRIGRPVAYALLYPVSVYYIFTTATARRAIRRFLAHAQTAPVTWSMVFRQYYNFGATLLDRVYILQGDQQNFDVTVVGAEQVQQALAGGRGCILLGAHLGSFEIARASAVLPNGTPLRILMHEANASLARELTAYLNPEAAAAVIPAGTPETMLKVKECLDQGGIIGILGDRVLDEQRASRCDFFGQTALFPDSPLRLAAALGVPIVLFFGLLRGSCRYELCFERFADHVVLTAPNRHTELHAWLQRYAQRLEHYCRLAPDNWFNFFDFWCEHE